MIAVDTSALMAIVPSSVRAAPRQTDEWPAIIVQARDRRVGQLALVEALQALVQATPVLRNDVEHFSLRTR